MLNTKEKSVNNLKQGSEYRLTKIPPFQLIALFYFKNLMYSSLFKGLCECALPSSIKEANGNKLGTKH